MSQSPLEAETNSPQALLYRQGWKALNRLLHEDRSFSGGERNCAFLNCGGRGFADISAASGFDFPDDARAVVAEDWDFDGDLDLWVTCRTAPRLRLLQNTVQAAGGSWVALQLAGDGVAVNRDAVGAVAEVWLRDTGVPLSRVVHGGDAFLSQSGSWLHFGLGADAAITKVVVHWPGGARQEVEGVEAGGFYMIDHGADAARPWQAPATLKPLAAAPQEPAEEDETARIVLPARLSLPNVEGLGDLRGPLLLNIWSSQCAPCIAELDEWTHEYDRLQAAGLRLLALNADPDGPEAATSFPFSSGKASPLAVRVLDLFQRAMLDRWMPMPVPTSFLIDSEGRVAAIYKGRVSVEQLLADIRLLDAPPEAWRVAALPFPGHFISQVPKPEPLRVSSQLIDAAQPGIALRYLQGRVAAGLADSDVERVIAVLRNELEPRDPGAAMLAKADALRDRGEIRAAIAAYKETLGKSPKTLAAAEHLAWVLAAHPDADLRNPQEARALAVRLCAMTKYQNAAYLDLLGAAQAALGEFKAAEASVQKALKLIGDKPEAEALRSRLALYRDGKAFVQ